MVPLASIRSCYANAVCVYGARYAAIISQLIESDPRRRSTTIIHLGHELNREQAGAMRGIGEFVGRKSAIIRVSCAL